VREPLKILVYGYGNPGRQDDGLGVLLSEEIEQWAHENDLNNLQTDSNYQLNIEDALRISSFDLVIFADASQEDIKGFAFTPLESSAKVEFTMHAVSPAFILNLCHEIYHKKPLAYLLHITGYGWEFMQEMTPEARKNLEEAAGFLKKKILEYKK
jgi:hydrogenase maturation protease